MKTVAITSLGIAATIYGLATLGYSESTGAVEPAAKSKIEAGHEEPKRDGSGANAATHNHLDAKREFDTQMALLNEMKRDLLAKEKVGSGIGIPELAKAVREQEGKVENLRKALAASSQMKGEGKPVDAPLAKGPDGYPIARAVPGKQGFVFSPYNEKLVDVRDMPPGTLVQDPTFPPAARKYFHVPAKADAVEKDPVAAQSPDEAKIDAKLRQIVIPRIDFEDTSLEEAIDFLRFRAAELDPEKAGIHFSIHLPKDKPMPRIAELRLRNVPIRGILKFICAATSTGYKVEHSAIAIVPLGEMEAEGAIGGVDEKAVADAISAKLRRIIIPVVDFENTTLGEAVDFVRLRAAELDVAENDPAKKGINFVIQQPRAAVERAGLGVDLGSLRIAELRLRNVPLAVVLKFICDATKTTYKVDEYGVTIIPITG